MNESAVFGPGVQNLWLNRKKKRSSTSQQGSEGIPTEVSNLLGDAEKHYINGEYEEATKILSTVVQKSPYIPEPFSILALIYEEIGDSYHALQLYALSASLASKNVDLWEKVFIYGIKIGEYEQSLNALVRCIKLRGDQDFYRLRIMLLIKQGKLHSMRDCLKTYLETFGNDILIYADIGSCFYNQGYFRLAIDNLLKFLSFCLIGISDTEFPAKSITQATYEELDWIIEHIHSVFDACRVVSLAFLELDRPFSAIELLENLFELFHQLKEISCMTTSPISAELTDVEYPIELLLLLGYSKLLVVRNEGDFDAAVNIIQPLLTTIMSETGEFFANVNPTFAPIPGTKEKDTSSISNVQNMVQELVDAASTSVDYTALVTASANTTPTAVTAPNKKLTIDPNQFDIQLFLLKILSSIMYQLYEQGMKSRALKMMDFLLLQCHRFHEAADIPSTESLHSVVTFIGKQCLDMEQYQATNELVDLMMIHPIYQHVALDAETLILSANLFVNHSLEKAVVLLPYYQQFIKMLFQEYQIMLKKLLTQSESEKEHDEEEEIEVEEQKKRKPATKGPKSKPTKAPTTRSSSSKGDKTISESSNNNDQNDPLQAERELMKAAMAGDLKTEESMNVEDDTNVINMPHIQVASIPIEDEERMDVDEDEERDSDEEYQPDEEEEVTDDEETRMEQFEYEQSKAAEAKDIGNEEDDENVMIDVMNIAPELLSNLELLATNNNGKDISSSSGKNSLSVSNGVSILADVASSLPASSDLAFVPTLPSTYAATAAAKISDPPRHYFTPWHDKSALHRSQLYSILQVLAQYVMVSSKVQLPSRLYCTLIIGFLEAHYKYITNKYRLKTRDNIPLRYLWPKMQEMMKKKGYIIEKIQDVPGIPRKSAMTWIDLKHMTSSKETQPSAMEEEVEDRKSAELLFPASVNSGQITLSGRIVTSAGPSQPTTDNKDLLPRTSERRDSRLSEEEQVLPPPPIDEEGFVWMNEEEKLVHAIIFYFSDYIQIDNIFSRAQLLHVLPTVLIELQQSMHSYHSSYSTSSTVTHEKNEKSLIWKDIQYLYNLYHYIQLSPDIIHHMKKQKYYRRAELTDYLADPMDEYYDDEEMIQDKQSFNIHTMSYNMDYTGTGGTGGGTRSGQQRMSAGGGMARKKYYHKKDELLEGIRQSTVYREMRGITRKSNPNDVFLLAAEKISLTCKEAASLVLQDLQNVHHANVLFHTVIDHMLQQQTKNSTSQGMLRAAVTSGSNNSSSSSSASLAPLTAYESLFVENQLPVRHLLTVSGGKDSAIAHLLVGHHVAIYKRHHEAIDAYLHAYTLAPQHALISLCLGSYLIMLASHPLIKDRMDTVLKGFAFLLNYRSLRLEQDQKVLATFRAEKKKKQQATPKDRKKDEVEEEAEEDQSIVQELSVYQETLYNLGRAFQELKLNHLASHAYQQAIDMTDTYPAWYAKHADLTVTKEAVHNLILLYRQNPQTKRFSFQLMQKYLKFA